MSKPKGKPENARPVDPMFDGHLEWPVERMTDAQRLQWAWEGAQLLYWARRAKFVDEHGQREGGSATGPNETTPRE